MNPNKQFLINQFEARSGVKVISARAGVGSMRGYTGFTISAKDDMVKNFINNYYGDFAMKSLGEVPVKFLDSEFNEKVVVHIINSHLL